MTSIILSDRFINDLSMVESDRVYQYIKDDVTRLEHIPHLGNSRDVPQSIKEAYGSDIRVIPVSPFLIVYEYDKQCDLCDVKGLIPQRQAR